MLTERLILIKYVVTVKQIGITCEVIYRCLSQLKESRLTQCVGKLSAAFSVGRESSAAFIFRRRRRGRRWAADSCPNGMSPL